MRNSERFSRFVEKHKTAVTVTALLVLSGILLACGWGASGGQTQTSPEPTLPPLSQWVKARCQFVNTVTGEVHDQAVVAPSKGGVGFEEGSFCYENDGVYKGMIDRIRSGAVDQNDVTIGSLGGGPVTQMDIGQ